MSVWQPLKNVYKSLAVYHSESRPCADQVVRLLVTEHVSIIQLPFSQTNVSSMFLETHASSSHTVVTKNACTFIALIVGDRVMKMSNVHTVSMEDLCTVQHSE